MGDRSDAIPPLGDDFGVVDRAGHFHVLLALGLDDCVVAEPLVVGEVAPHLLLLLRGSHAILLLLGNDSL